MCAGPAFPQGQQPLRGQSDPRLPYLPALSTPNPPSPQSAALNTCLDLVDIGILNFPPKLALHSKAHYRWGLLYLSRIIKVSKDHEASAWTLSCLEEVTWPERVHDLCTWSERSQPATLGWGLIGGEYFGIYMFKFSQSNHT